MKKINLPADTEHLYLDEVAHLIADCFNPEGPHDPDSLRYKGALEALASELERDANSGALRTRHPETLGLIPPVLIPADPLDRLLDCTFSVPLRFRVVTVADFGTFVADRGITVVMEAPEHTATPVPAKDAPGGSGTVWTAERKEAARAMMNQSRGQGIKAFAANTAAAFGVTPTRLREVLNDKPKKGPAKKSKGVWDV